MTYLYRLKQQPIVLAWVVSYTEIPPDWISNYLRAYQECYKLFASNGDFRCCVYEGDYLVKHSDGIVQILSKSSFDELYESTDSLKDLEGE